MRKHNKWLAIVALLLALLPSLPIPQVLIQFSMLVHMAVQLPLLLIAGYCLATTMRANHAIKQLRLALPWQWVITAWIWVYFSIIFWMLPIHLDKVLMFATWDILKIISLLGSGALLWLLAKSPITWGVFFIGSLAIGLIFLGVYYQQATVRVCSNYLIASQHRAGFGLFIWGVSLLTFSFYKTKHQLLPQE